MNRESFGKDFQWGIATAAFQIEGACNEDGKGASIWDEFTALPGRIYQNQHARTACDFYHQYQQDIALVKELSIPNFRFSLAWSRILPEGIGVVNEAGIDYYNKVIDHCLSQGLEPWVTLYHWDLPAALSKKGGWTNRQIVEWFKGYVEICVRAFGDRVKHWMILNEPTVFTGAGYFLGIHAPGQIGLGNFLPAVHHAALCQAEGARIVKFHCPDSEVGTTISCTLLEPVRKVERHINATRRADALTNRLFIEPALGLGYPIADLKPLRKLEKWIQPGDEQNLIYDFDFIGIQNYTREIIKHSLTVPYIFAKPVAADRRNVATTLMNWEVYPDALYQILTLFRKRYRLKKIIVTENGAAFRDKVKGEEIADSERIQYLNDNLKSCLRAKYEGVPLEGYFVWTLTDNFEWAEGYRPTFGLVHVDFRSQQRLIKNSGYWYKSFLEHRKNLS